MHIVSGKCILRSFQESDARSLAKHANNIKIWQQLRDIFPYPYTEKDAIKFIDFARSQKPECNFVIDVNTEAVGAIGIVLGSDIERFSAEIGYWLSEEHWGKGIMTGALKNVTRYLFENWNLNRIYALPFASNVGSIKVLENTGYVKEGLLKKSAYKNNRFEDQFIYAFVSS